MPPHALFAASAVFHYLGPSFAVLLFASIAPLGVAWLRIALASVALAVWQRVWRVFPRLGGRELRLVLALGVILAAMNSVFYLAISRLPLATVGAIEFIGPVALAATGTKTPRNWMALGLALLGLSCLLQIRFDLEPLGFALAVANALLFCAYIVVGHHLARAGGGTSSLERLGAAMVVAAPLALPLGLYDALPAFADAKLFAAALAVALTSSVIPYALDQLAMQRLPRASFALMLSILPAVATMVGFVVLGQQLLPAELLGVVLVMTGVAAHRPADSH